MAIDDFVLQPRRVEGCLVAERLRDGVVVKFDQRYFERSPLVYRGSLVYVHINTGAGRIAIDDLYEAVREREGLRG